MFQPGPWSRLSQCGGGALDGGADFRIGAAAPQIAGQGTVEVAVRWVGICGQQGGRLHDLTVLTVSALRGAGFTPTVIDFSAKQLETLKVFNVQAYYCDPTRPGPICCKPRALPRQSFS